MFASITTADRVASWQAVRAFRHRNYRWFFTGAFLANIGGWLAGIARGYLVYELTGSKLLLGTIAFASTLPTMFLVPFTGVIVDRVHRKPLMAMTQSTFLVTNIVMALLIATGHIRFEYMVILALIDGLAQAFQSPAWQSLTVEFVGEEDLMNAIALNSMQFNMGRIGGGLAGGMLYDFVGPSWCFGINALMLGFGLYSLMQLGIRPPSPKASRTNAYMNFVLGMRYLRRRPALKAIVGMAAGVTVFALPYFTMLPVYAKDILNGDARTQSYLLTAIGVGALMAALMQAVDRTEGGWGRKMLYSQIVLAISVAIFATSSRLPVSLIALMGCGASMVGFMTSANTSMQLLVPDHMRGRLMGVFVFVSMGLTPIGSILMGWSAQRWGAPIALTVGAAIAGTATLWVMLRMKHVREI